MPVARPHKTACVYHSIDLDGWCSAAIIKYHYPNAVLIGYNYGQILPDLSGYDEIIMVDISFPLQKMYDLWMDKELILVWIDHHISAIKDMNAIADREMLTENPIQGIRDTRFAACELTWKYFFPDKQIPEAVRLLGRYDCFGHKGTDEELKVLQFQYAARQRWNNPETVSEVLSMNMPNLIDDMIIQGTAIYSFLCEDAKQSYRNGFRVDIMDKKIIMVNKERFNPVNFGIDYHADGYDIAGCFHYGQGKWRFSLYNDNGNTDVSVICKNYGGGGHAGAAGFVADDIDFLFKYRANA